MRCILTFMMFLMLGLTVATARAGVFVPAGLNHGDEYHLAFITQGTSTKPLVLVPNIEDYNDFVQAEAALNPSVTGTDMGVTWKVIGSTALVDARDNALIEAPVYRIDGELLATGFGDMWDGSLLAPLWLNQFGIVQAVGPQGEPYTGSQSDGTAASSHELSALGTTRYGRANQVNSSWIDSSSNDDELIIARSLYALSGKITVVPEPSSFMLAALGLLGLGLCGWRRKRKLAA